MPLSALLPPLPRRFPDAPGLIAAIAENGARDDRDASFPFDSLERHWRDVQCARVHVPTEDAAHRNAGRAALGVGAAA